MNCQHEHSAKDIIDCANRDDQGFTFLCTKCKQPIFYEADSKDEIYEMFGLVDDDDDLEYLVDDDEGFPYYNGHVY